MVEAVRHEDVLVEVVGARGTVILHLVNHLADRKDGGGGGVGLDFRGGRRRGFRVRLAGETFICNQATEREEERLRHQNQRLNSTDANVYSPSIPSAPGLIREQKPVNHG